MKNVIITGASSGIGQALAHALDNGAYRLVLSGRNKERLQTLTDSLSCEHLVHIGDVREYDDCQELVNSCLNEFGGVDVLINNAGLGHFDPLHQGKIEEWHRMVDVNVKGVLNCLHSAMPSLIEQRGHVINIGSIASHHVFPNSGVYCATKHALFGISESIRVELNGRVKVTTISPGAVDTDFINKTTNEEIHGNMKDYFASAMRPKSIAVQIKHAIESPEDSVVNEIIVRPFRSHRRPA
ncbi:MAG: SDR family oxidoreductase [Flavobacteriales bacterium]|nr:SDR family oxidoreductase [Flavobacteriales bacterium]